jgi:PAS domain S-box-containing protein
MSASDGSEHIKIQRLRDQINEKMSYSQQRARALTPRTASGLGGRRVSPIKEEGSGSGSGISPTLEDAFSSPLPTGAQTTSTESTESARTIRGTSVPSTPNAAPLRTPSYPFPYVGTPRVWSSSNHRPFTTLSPTVSASNVHDRGAPHDGSASELSTPLAAANVFMPPGASPMPEADEDRFPTPNLYELTLELSLEPGLLSWWTAVSRILSRDFGATRASLSMPADAGELESVPWGQKATFCITGPPQADAAMKRTEPILKIPEFKHFQGSNKAGPLRHVHEENMGPHPGLTKRPSMPSRHSYAGYEKPELATATPSSRVERPKGPMRTKSHVPQPIAPMMHRSPEQQILTPSPGGPAQTRGNAIDFNDPDFSSIESIAPPGPFRAILPTLRALNYESHALINSTYVNRIIERGKTVILTRDYSGDDSSRKGSVDTATGDQSHRPSVTSEPTKPKDGKPKEKGKVSHDYFSRDKPVSAYDEYEQFPSSPWAQSPAPSPAIQSDAEENPFFASGHVDEESFDPTDTTPDYAKLTQVEAIGVERASTVIHIPFMHPLLSQNLPSNAIDADPDTPTGIQFGRLARYYDGSKSAEGDQTHNKKAPIAILSILSPIVPYPHNLAHSLKMLALHLATSFANAHQYTSAHRQASSILQRRMNTGQKMGFPAFSTDAEGLEYLAEADLDISAPSTTGSVTSPSDYSGRSRASPGGSIGTPGWDPSATFSSRQATGGTPGQGAEMIDSYFEAKKKSTATRSISISHKSGRQSPPLQTPMQYQMAEEDFETPKNSQRRPRTVSQESSTAASGVRLEPLNTRGGNMASPRRVIPKVASATPALNQNDRKRHSLLHSYGADFNSTFQGLSSTTAIPGRMGTGQTQGGENAGQDMLPPSERLLRTIIDALPVQIFTASPGSGSLTWANSKFVAYRGREPHEIIQDPWQAIHPGDREHYMDQWQRSLSTGQPFAHKVRLQRFDNQYRWFFVRATPLKDKRQNTVHWTGTYMDIHEQHVAEVSAARQQETAASEARYRALANSSPQIVFAVTQDRGVTFCNSQWLLYAGQTEAQARALGFMDFVHPEDLAKCRLPTINQDGSFVVDAPTTIPMETKQKDSSDDSSETDKTVTSPGGISSPGMGPMPQKKLSELAGTGILKISRDSDGRPSYTTEVRLRNKDGEYRWHLVRVLLSTPVRGDDDEEDEEEETWYGTCTDINDHKLLEQTLKETMDAKSRFLSNMSHEIRTPLNGITGMVNFLIDSHLSQEQLEHVHIIRNSTEGLRDLINDILDLSKVEAGMISLSYDWLHLRSLIEEVNDLTSAMAVGKGLELNYLIEDNVPPMVKGDRFRLRQVLLNVVGNAIKFTQHGEVYVNCQLSRDQPADMDGDEMMLCFNISDTGSGFTEKEAEYLFKRFSQIDSSSTKQHGGTGLGLAISMQLVELHGGRMTASSVPNRGSTFTFTVKFRIPSADDQPPDFPMATPAAQDETIDRRLSSHIPRAAASYTPGLPPMPPVSISETNSPIVQSPIRFHHESAASSGSSDPSIRTGRTTSLGSHRSSASSLTEPIFNKSQPISLELPSHLRGGRPTTMTEASVPSSNESVQTVKPPREESSSRGISPTPPAMYSILVVCPLTLSRTATVKHIETTIPKNLPSHITAPNSVDDCKKMLGMVGEDDPVLFTHIVVMLHDVAEIIDLVNQALRSPPYSSTSILIITDFQQRKEIEEQAKEFNYKQLVKDTNRIRWVYKPLKPSKFAVIFDPEKLRELSTDRSQDSAQAVVVSQKQVFDEMRRRLGNRGIRVLLVEDNKTNQMVGLVS